MANQSDVHRHIETGLPNRMPKICTIKTLKRLYAYADDADVDLNQPVIYDETMLGSTLEIRRTVSTNLGTAKHRECHAWRFMF